MSYTESRLAYIFFILYTNLILHVEAEFAKIFVTYGKCNISTWDVFWLDIFIPQVRKDRIK